MDWATIFKASEVDVVDGLITKYQVLFEKYYGHLKQFKASIHVREDAQPIFLKARPVPYALKEKVEQELLRLEEKGIIYKMSQIDWAALVVSVPSAPAIFQLIMDQLLPGVKFTVCRLDDILRKFS